MSLLFVIVSVPACLVLALLLTILLVKRFCPAAFFKFKGGYILHVMTGGSLPPYFVTWPWEDKYVDKLLRDGDVVCAVGTKSGTTWMLNIVHQIRTLGDPKGFLQHNTYTTPWPEFNWWPGETPEEALEILATMDGIANPEYPFRVFKSHYKPRAPGAAWKEARRTLSVLPVRQKLGVKYVVCMRDGRDMMASFYHHANSINQKFKGVWGGFPPNFECMDQCCKFVTRTYPEAWFGFCSRWWPYRHDPNVLLLHYNDLKSDIKSCLRQISDFVGVSVPDSAWPLIEEKVSLRWMKENEAIFKYHVSSKYYTGNVFNDEEGSFVRKGAVGEGKKQLTPEQEQMWEETCQRWFADKPGLHEWVQKGGPLPPLTPAEEPKGSVSNLATPLLTK